MVITADVQASAKFDLFLFGSSPVGGGQTDHASFAINPTDFGRICGVMHITDVSSAGPSSFFQSDQPPLPVISSSGTVYGTLVQRGTFTPTSTQDLVVTLQFESD
jgi:hypothetical protein